MKLRLPFNPGYRERGNSAWSLQAVALHSSLNRFSCHEIRKRKPRYSEVEWARRLIGFQMALISVNGIFVVRRVSSGITNEP